MSLTYLSVKVANPFHPKKMLTHKLLVDSGAVFSVLPREELQKLGIKPDSSQRFILASGQEIVKPVGEARFIYKDSQRTAPVVFGEKDVYILGATTLETMGLALDPINRRLEKLPLLM